MVALVTLAQAQAHLRLEVDPAAPDAADVNLKIGAASGIILKQLADAADFLNPDGSVPVDGAGNPIVPELVQEATLLLIGCFYSDREGSVLLAGGLPNAVMSLLNCYGRTPAMA